MTIGELLSSVGYDTGSIEITTLALLAFWTLVTILALSLRTLVIHLLSAADEVTVDAGHVDTTDETVQPPARPVQTITPQWASFRSPLLLALLDAIAAMEVCACSLECWPIRAVAGHNGLMIAIAANAIRGAIFTYRDAYGSACNPWYRYLLKQTKIHWLLITWCLQLVGTSCALQLARWWWSQVPSVHHAARYELALAMDRAKHWPAEELEAFPPDLQVSSVFGFMIEAFATFVDFFLASLMMCLISHWNRCCSTVNALPTTSGQQLTPTGLQSISSFAVRLFINLALTSKCIYLTGLYANPLNAFVQSWGVGGVSHLTHLFVYWGGPLVGVWLALLAERYVTCQLATLMTPRPSSSVTPVPSPAPSFTASPSQEHSESVQITKRPRLWRRSKGQRVSSSLETTWNHGQVPCFSFSDKCGDQGQLLPVD